MEPIKANEGIKKLVRISRKTFRIPENLLYYDPQAYQEAERTIIKFVIQQGSLKGIVRA